MATRTNLTDPLAERATAVLTLTLTDTDGVTALANADTVLISLTLTLYDEATGNVINSRSAQSILGANGGSVSSAGVLTLRLDPADMAISNSWPRETHVALLTWTWGSPLKTGIHEVAFVVSNFAKVPAA